jgi:small subunit ribosomal protein S1
MFSDHDNPVSAAAAAPAHETQSKATPQAAAQESAAAEVPVAEAPALAAAAPEAAEVHANAEAQAAETVTDAEATAAAEEAASKEEMSKLLDQYDEQQENAANNEIIEVKVIAYTEHGVVVDIGQKTEGLIPAAEFSETEIPRPDPNATIEVQRTGEKKDGYVIVSYQKVLRRRTWEKLDEAYKNKTTLTGKVVDRIKGGVVVDVGVRAFLPGSQYDLRPTPNLDAFQPCKALQEAGDSPSPVS